MATKQLETLSGAVEQVNAKQTGLKVLGEWLNISQYHPIAVMPTPGELVQVQIERTDKGAWINSLQIIGASSSPTSSSSRERTINRSVALKAAAAFAAGKCIGGVDVKSVDVLRIAEAWLDWIEEVPPTA